jgi:hypothetical protein
VTDAHTDIIWRVGYVGDPLGFVPRERSEFGHRFDDPQQRFRSVYAALLPETCLREVLADLRPNAAAVARFIETFGPEAANDLAPHPLTAAWRRQNALAPARLRLADGRHLLDLTDPQQCRDIEHRHAALLAEHGLAHLDFHEITTRRRILTQTIAADAFFDLGTGAIRFPSSRDGNPCYVVLEGGAWLEAAGAPLALTDPPPEPLVNVCAGWGLVLEPAAAGTGASR